MCSSEITLYTTAAKGHNYKSEEITTFEGIISLNRSDTMEVLLSRIFLLSWQIRVDILAQLADKGG